MHTTKLSDRDLLVSPHHLDERLDRFPIPNGAFEVSSPPSTTTLAEQWMLDHYRRIADATARVDRSLVLAGDCLTAVGVVAGLQCRHDDLAIVWLDAHGDFNTPEISTSGYLAGMSLAMLTGRSAQPFCGPLAMRPIPDHHVVLVDARDLDAAERDALQASDVKRVGADPAALRAALARLAGRPVYLHLDVDVVNSADLPGLRFPVAGGPSLSRIEECLVEIVTAVEPVAAYIACAWSPQRIGEELTRESIRRLASAIGEPLHWPTDPASNSPTPSA
jgi:arginase